MIGVESMDNKIKRICHWCPTATATKQPEQVAEVIDDSQEFDPDGAVVVMCKQCALDETNGMLGSFKEDDYA
jgi:hypothetical protein